jgi:hypothetical protein
MAHHVSAEIGLPRSVTGEALFMIGQGDTAVGAFNGFTAVLASYVVVIAPTV